MRPCATAALTDTIRRKHSIIPARQLTAISEPRDTISLTALSIRPSGSCRDFLDRELAGGIVEGSADGAGETIDSEANLLQSSPEAGALIEKELQKTAASVYDRRTCE